MAISSRTSFRVSGLIRQWEARVGEIARAVSTLNGARFVLVSLHAVKMWDWFRHVDFTSSMPIMNVDYVQFYGRALRAHEFLSSAGRFWGYDPFDMAGYVSGPYLEVGVHLISVIAHVLSPLLPVGVTLLALEVAAPVLAPFLIIPAVRNLGGTRAQAWSAFGAVLLVVGFLDPFSETLYRVGLYGFMTSGFVSVLQVSLAWRWLVTGSWKSGLWYCAVTALLFQIHPAALIIVAIPNAVFLLGFGRRLGPTRMLATAGFGAVVVAANYYWIRPFIAFSEWKTDAPYFVTAGFREVWHMFNPWRTDLFLCVRIIMLVYILGLAVATVASLWRRSRSLAAGAMLWLAGLFSVGYFGSSISVLQSLQPGRNSFAFWLVAAVAAGMSLPTIALAHSGRRWFTVGLYAFAAALMFAPVNRPGRSFPVLSNRLPNDQMELVEALKERRVDARIMVECVDLLTPHVADLFPFLIPGQAFLGGQHPGNFTMGRFSLFSGAYVTSSGWVKDEPVAFSRSLARMGAETLEDYLRLYNVGLVASRTPSAQLALADFPTLLGEPVRAGAYEIRPVIKKFSWFDQGSGRVAFEFDRIRVEGASKGRLVLKSHWIRTLKVDPPLPIAPVYLADDPAPFIEIDNAAGLDRFVVYNAGL